MNLSIEQIIRAGGGVVALSKKLRITKGAVSQWHRVPVNRVFDVEKITGIPRSQIRPDIFDEQTKVAA